MAKTYEYEDPMRLGLIRELRQAAKGEGVAIWNSIAMRLSKSRKNRTEVNIHKLNKFTKKGDTVVVPGKVLGTGKLDHNVNVAAFGFTEQARREIESAGGKAFTITELIKNNSKGSGVKIMG